MNKSLNVIQIIDSLAVGGAEVMAVNIANGLAKKDMGSHLCVSRKEGMLKDNLGSDVGYLFLNKQGIFDFKAVFTLRKYIRQNNIGIIHAHSSSFFIAVLVKLITFNLKIVWHDHYGKAEEVNNRKSVALKIASLFFHSIISVNALLVDWAKEKLFTKKVKFLANFASLNSKDKVSVLKGENGKRIICVAVFRPQKDHFNLLKAFSAIKSNYPEWTLHLIGQKHDDIYSKGIDEIIIDKKLKEHVFFYGSCLDVNNVLDQASIGVLSSNSEGLPVSLLEYGLAGLPVVVTDVGACKMVVNNFGLVVEKENHTALAEAIESYILDENLRKTNAIQFQKHIFDNYSEESYFSKLINIYQAC